MATTGQLFELPHTGDRIIVRTSGRETNGAWAAFEVVHPHRGRPTFAHFHPTRDEDFEILAGSASYRLAGVTRHVRTGDRFTLPLGVAHVHPWNTTDEELRFAFILRAPQPDMHGMLMAEAAFETLARLSREGRLKRDLTPKSLLQAALVFHAAMPSIYLAGMPVPLQRMVFGALARLAQIRGYKAFSSNSSQA